MSGPVLLSGPAFRPLLTPLDFASGKARMSFLGDALMVKPLLSGAMGRGHIASTVQKQEAEDPAPLPISRRVLLFVEPTMQLVAETVSNADTGAYRFDGLNPEARFTVVALDHLHKFRGVLADNLTPAR